MVKLDKSELKIEKSVKTIRTSKYELLRFIAAFMVIFFHAAFGYGRSDWLYANLNTFLVVPVVLFIFMSGYFLINSKNNRVTKFLVILFVYYFVNLICSVIILKIFNLMPGSYTINQLLKFGWGPWWYFWTLPFLYLIVPIMNYTIKNLNKWYSLFLAVLIYLSYYFFSGINYQTILPPTQLILFIAVYMFGAWWKEHSNQNYKLMFLLVAISYLLIIQVLNNVMFAVTNKSLFMYIDDAKKDTSQPLTILAAWSVFVIFENINIKYNRFLNFLGQLSLPLYLFQALLMTVVGTKIISHDSFTSPILGTLAFAFCSFALTLLLSIVLIYPINFFIKYLDKWVMMTINFFKKYYQIYWKSDKGKSNINLKNNGI